MASIVYNNSNARVNPTPTFYPVNIGGKFVDSNLQWADGVLFSVFGTGYIGLKLDTPNSRYILGDYNGISNITWFGVDDANQQLEVSAPLTSGVKVLSNKFIRIKVNSVSYLLPLYIP